MGNLVIRRSFEIEPSKQAFDPQSQESVGLLGRIMKEGFKNCQICDEEAHGAILQQEEARLSS